MLFENLRAELKTKVAPCYLLKGSDIFLINKSIELILGVSKIDRMNVTQFDEVPTDDQINAILQNVSMFGGKNAVVIRLVDETRMVLARHKKSEIISVDCNPMSETLVVKLITQNKNFSPEVATHLARLVDNNFSRVNMEMEKLTALCGENKVTIADVDTVVTKTEKYQTWELGTALLRRDATRVKAILKNIEDTGADEYAVFGGLLAILRRLFYVTSSKKSDAEIAKVLEVHPYSVISVRRDARITVEEAMRLYELALNYEYEIKSGKILAERATTLLVGEMM